MKLSKEQVKAVSEELRNRSKKIKGYKADTLKEEFVFIGYAEAYEKLAKELEEKGGLLVWD